MQGRHHFAARTVAINAQNTVVAVRRFAAKNICAVFIAIEAHAEGFKVAYAVGRLARDKAGNRRIDQSGTGGAGVSGMGFNTVAGASAAAMPPWAQLLAALLLRLPPVKTVTWRGASFSAVNRPARPAPIISTSPASIIFAVGELMCGS